VSKRSRKAKNQAATGARFLDAKRSYSAASFEEVEHYCLDCTFRPWMDATNNLTATVKIGSKTETVRPDANGHFVTNMTAQPGTPYTIEIKDAWGDHS